MWHAARVRREPARSPTFAIDEKKRHEGLHLDAEGGDELLSGRQQAVLWMFTAGIGVLIFGVLSYGWYIIEIAALFLALGLLIGVVGGLGANGTARAFMDGARATSWRRPSSSASRAAF